jgi:hypothetical protein
MKRFVLSVFSLSLLGAHAFASKDDAFPLSIHIAAVTMEQGQRGVVGTGRTDSNGDYSSDVSGGGTYTWRLYRAQIDGDKKTYQLSTAPMHYKGGAGLAIATMGWSAIATARSNYGLQIGDYRGHWNKNGTLEIQFIDPKGKLIHQTFSIEAEDPAQAAPVASPAGPVASLTVESNVRGADIEIDGAFVGNTPSTLSVTPGQHTISVKKKGYVDWSRTVSVSGSGVRLSAEMDLRP